MILLVFRMFRHYKARIGVSLTAAVVAVLTLQGCAGLSIPAPDAPLQPLVEPAVRDSIISLPITLSVSSLMNNLGLPPAVEDPDRDRRIAGKIRGFLQRQANKNENIGQNTLVQQQIGKAWDVLQKPISLKSGWQLYIRPQAVSLTPVSEEGETVRVIAELLARPMLLAQGSPAPAPEPLPSFSLSSAPSGTGFHVALRIEVPYEQLGRELTERLRGKSFNAAGNTVVVDAVRAYGSGQTVVLAAAVSGSLHGTLYLQGRPVYDQQSEALTLAGVDYTIDTTNVLVRAADWIRHAGLREHIASKTTWYAGDRIDQAKSDLQRALNRTVNDRVSMSGTIERVRPVTVGVTATGVAAIVEADGSIEMHFY
jgi:hypothetical protein